MPTNKSGYGWADLIQTFSLRTRVVASWTFECFNKNPFLAKNAGQDVIAKEEAYWRAIESHPLYHAGTQYYTYSATNDIKTDWIPENPWSTMRTGEFQSFSNDAPELFEPGYGGSSGEYCWPAVTRFGVYYPSGCRWVAGNAGKQPTQGTFHLDGPEYFSQLNDSFIVKAKYDQIESGNSDPWMDGPSSINYVKSTMHDIGYVFEYHPTFQVHAIGDLEDEQAYRRGAVRYITNFNKPQPVDLPTGEAFANHYSPLGPWKSDSPTSLAWTRDYGHAGDFGTHAECILPCGYFGAVAGVNPSTPTNSLWTTTPTRFGGYRGLRIEKDVWARIKGNVKKGSVFSTKMLEGTKYGGGTQPDYDAKARIHVGPTQEEIVRWDRDPKLPDPTGKSSPGSSWGQRSWGNQIVPFNLCFRDQLNNTNAPNAAMTLGTQPFEVDMFTPFNDPRTRNSLVRLPQTPFLINRNLRHVEYEQNGGWTPWRKFVGGSQGWEQTLGWDFYDSTTSGWPMFTFESKSEDVNYEYTWQRLQGYPYGPGTPEVFGTPMWSKNNKYIYFSEPRLANIKRSTGITGIDHGARSKYWQYLFEGLGRWRKYVEKSSPGNPDGGRMHSLWYPQGERDWKTRGDSGGYLENTYPRRGTGLASDQRGWYGLVGTGTAQSSIKNFGNNISINYGDGTHFGFFNDGQVPEATWPMENPPLEKQMENLFTIGTKDGYLKGTWKDPFHVPTVNLLDNIVIRSQGGLGQPPRTLGPFPNAYDPVWSR